jgi:hypothetical protein
MVAGQYSQDPEILARFVFFSEFKQLVPEAIENLKESCFDLRNKMCYQLIRRGMQLDKYIESKPIEMRGPLRRLMLGSGDFEDEKYKELSSEYDESLKAWASRWNLGIDQWEREEGWIIGQAAREIDTFLDPIIADAYSQYDFMSIYMRELEERQKGIPVSREQIKMMYSPKEMSRIYGRNWRKKLEKDGETWEETVELMTMPTAQEEPALFRKLFNKLINMLPDQTIIFIPIGNDFTYTNEGWNLQAESRSQAVKRIMADFKKSLDGYLDFKEAQAREQGLQPVPTALRRKLQKERHRFEWLIRYQTQGWSRKKIAEHYAVDRNAVQESVKTEAKLIGLRLRDQTDEQSLND